MEQYKCVNCGQPCVALRADLGPEFEHRKAVSYCCDAWVEPYSEIAEQIAQANAEQKSCENCASFLTDAKCDECSHVKLYDKWEAA